jgi:hypothetical protein
MRRLTVILLLTSLGLHSLAQKMSSKSLFVDYTIDPIIQAPQTI